MDTPEPRITFEEAVIAMIRRGNKEEFEAWKRLYGSDKLKKIWNEHLRRENANHEQQRTENNSTKT